jgi:uncharacterized membrane protein YfcA
VAVSLGVAALAVATLVWMVSSDAAVTISLRKIASTIVFALIAFALARYVHVRVPNWKKEATFAILAVIGAAIAKVHAKWLDPAYLRAGHRSRFEA